MDDSPEDGVPLPPDGYIVSPYKCVIDYNILGLLSIGMSNNGL